MTQTTETTGLIDCTMAMAMKMFTALKALRAILPNRKSLEARHSVLRFSLRMGERNIELATVRKAWHEFVRLTGGDEADAKTLIKFFKFDDDYLTSVFDGAKALIDARKTIQASNNPQGIVFGMDVPGFGGSTAKTIADDLANEDSAMNRIMQA